MRGTRTLLVTGGAGFIGANFVRIAVARGARVVVLDKLTYAGSADNLAGLSAECCALVRGDICDRPLILSLLRQHRPSALVCFAAESHVDRSIDGPGDFVHTNIGGTFELLEAARAHLSELGPEARSSFRFLQVSTDEVFGSLGPAEPAFREDSRYAPSSPYAASKAASDHLVRAYHRTYGLPTLTTNCSNNYGPYQLPEKLVPRTILNAIEGKPLPVYGDGENVRDWIHVEDHCEAVLRALELGEPGETYNIGGGDEQTNISLVERICDVIEGIVPATTNPALAGRRSYRDLITFVEDRPGHDRRYAVDCSKIVRELGWAPRVPLGEGLARTVRWYLDNRLWCSRVGACALARERRGLGWDATARDAAAGAEP